jgi:hypothetical protein
VIVGPSVANLCSRHLSSLGARGRAAYKSDPGLWKCPHPRYDPLNRPRHCPNTEPARETRGLRACSCAPGWFICELPLIPSRQLSSSPQRFLGGAVKALGSIPQTPTSNAGTSKFRWTITTALLVLLALRWRSTPRLPTRSSAASFSTQVV